MIRRTVRRLFQFPPGSGGGAINPFADLMKPPPGQENNSGRFDGNFSANPFMDQGMLTQMRDSMRRSMTPEMQANVQRMMSDMTQGNANFPKMGVMAFGVGENERGKKVARGAKIEFDPNTGKISKDFQEHQLDPDDLQLPKETVETYETENCTEVQFEEDREKIAGGGGSKPGETLDPSEIEVETIEVEQPSKSSFSKK